jgi:putative zinc finger/helix-turn-helix YgiT family protein
MNGTFESEILADDGAHKVVTELHWIGWVGHQVERPMSRRADGTWGMSKDDERRFHDNLVQARRKQRSLPTPSQIRAFRKRFNLSQREASYVFGGGPRSFQKYESGQALPSAAMGQLMWLVKRDPELLKVLGRTHTW